MIRVVCVAIVMASGIGVSLAAPPLSEALSTSSSNADANVTPCSKEQYAAKFGALPTYSLLTSTFRPSLQNGFVKAQVLVYCRMASSRRRCLCIVMLTDSLAESGCSFQV